MKNNFYFIFSYLYKIKKLKSEKKNFLLKIIFLKKLSGDGAAN
jgi:hypothetical protein